MKSKFTQRRYRAPKRSACAMCKPQQRGWADKEDARRFAARDRAGTTDPRMGACVSHLTDVSRRSRTRTPISEGGSPLTNHHWTFLNRTPIPPPIAKFLAIFQIGRASCRESVEIT